jgi:hypothetical protein
MRVHFLVALAVASLLLLVGWGCGGDSGGSGNGGKDAIGPVDDVTPATDASEGTDSGADNGGGEPDVAALPDGVVAEDGGEPPDGQSSDAGEDLAVADDVASGIPGDPCDAMTDKNCLEIHRGESVYYRHIDYYPTSEFDDKGTVRTVIDLADLIDPEVAEEPDAWRYQIFGTDGYTFGGYAEWDHMLQGYMEVGARRVVWEPALELPDSWRVKDAWLITLSPAGK